VRRVLADREKAASIRGPGDERERAAKAPVALIGALGVGEAAKVVDRHGMDPTQICVAVAEREVVDDTRLAADRRQLIMDNEDGRTLIWINQSHIGIAPADLLEQGADGAAGFPIG